MINSIDNKLMRLSDIFQFTAGMWYENFLGAVDKLGTVAVRGK